jgi:hypothetical protein
MVENGYGVPLEEGHGPDLRRYVGRGQITLDDSPTSCSIFVLNVHTERPNLWITPAEFLPTI